jgi:hypothetical protein
MEMESYGGWSLYGQVELLPHSLKWIITMISFNLLSRVMCLSLPFPRSLYPFSFWPCLLATLLHSSIFLYHPMTAEVSMAAGGFCYISQTFMANASRR